MGWARLEDATREPPEAAAAPAPRGPAAYRIVREAPEHAAALEAVIDRAFGPGRFAKSSERVRERGARHRADLSRVALLDGAPVGVCRMYEVSVGGRSALFMGPLAVDPDHQHARLGVRLVGAALEAAKHERNAVLVVGPLAFFAPFGFAQTPHGRVLMPAPVDPERFLWLATVPGALDGLAGRLEAPSSRP
jgi:predicted N-acetyltransferase YhbS